MVMIGGGFDIMMAIWNSNYTGHGCVHSESHVSCALELAAKAMSKMFRGRL